jgi:hypothetical protein
MSGTSKTVALVCGIALAAGAAYWLRAGRGAAPEGDGAARSTARANDPAATDRGAGPVERASVVEAPNAAAKDAGEVRGAGARREDAGPRQVSESEKALVRGLIKQHPVIEPPEGVGVEATATIPTPWPIDDDSLYLEHGSRDRAGLEAERASIQAILDWQRNGPFEDKASELMPPGMLHAFEVELEWLRERLQEF